MDNFNSKILDPHKKCDIFDRMKKRYGEFPKLNTKNSILINNLNNIKFSENIFKNKIVKGGNKLKTSFFDLYSHFSLHILTYSSILLVFIHINILIFTLLKEVNIPSNDFDSSFFNTYYYINILKNFTIIFLSINILLSGLINIFKTDNNSNNTSDNKSNNPVIQIAIAILLMCIKIYILYLLYQGLLNNIYRFKLQGVIFPTVVVLGGIGLSLLYNKMNLYFSNVNIKNTSTFYVVKKVFKFYDGVIDFVPEIFNPLPKIPEISGNIPVLKHTREGIQELIIDTSWLDDDAIANYQINVSIPDIKVPFVNPIAAFCCAGIKIKQFGEMINKKVIDPACAGMIKIWNGIKWVGMLIYENTILPIINSFNYIKENFQTIYENIWYNTICVAIITITDNPIFKSFTSNIDTGDPPVEIDYSVLDNKNLSDYDKYQLFNKLKMDKRPLNTNNGIAALLKNNKKSYFEKKKRNAWEAKLRKKLVKQGYALDKAASKKAVNKVLGNLEKSLKKTTTVQEMQQQLNIDNLTLTSTINQSQEHGKTNININPKGGGTNKYPNISKPINNSFQEIHNIIQNNKYAKLGLPIILEIRKYKLQYLNKYYKKIDNLTNINYPVRKDTTKKDIRKIFKTIKANIHKKREKQKKKANILKNKLSTPTNVIQNFIDNSKKHNINSPLIKRILQNKVTKKDYKKNTENIINLVIDIYINKLNIIETKINTIKKKIKNKKINKNKKIILDNKIIYYKKQKNAIIKKFAKYNIIFTKSQEGGWAPFDAMADAWNKATDYMNDKINEAKDAVSKAASAAVEAAGPALNAIASAVSDIGNFIVELASAAWTWIKRAAMSLANTIKSIATKAKKAVDKFLNFFSVAKDFINDIPYKIWDLGKKIKNFFVNIANSIRIFLNVLGNFFKRAIPFVARIMLNISIILAWFLAVVVKKNLQLTIAFVRFTILILKTSTKSLIKATTTAFNAVKDNKPKISASMKFLMAINDIPFATIFRPIKDMISGEGNLMGGTIGKIIVKSIEFTLKLILDSMLFTPCIMIGTIIAPYAGLKRLCGLLNVSTSSFLGPVEPILQNLLDFTNQWCFTSITSLIPKKKYDNSKTDKQIFIEELEKQFTVFSNIDNLISLSLEIKYAIKDTNDKSIFQFPNFKVKSPSLFIKDFKDFDINKDYPFEKNGNIITYFPYQGLKSELYIKVHQAIKNLIGVNTKTIPFSTEQTLIQDLRNDKSPLTYSMGWNDNWWNGEKKIVKKLEDENISNVLNINAKHIYNILLDIDKHYYLNNTLQPYFSDIIQIISSNINNDAFTTLCYEKKNVKRIYKKGLIKKYIVGGTKIFKNTHGGWSLPTQATSTVSAISKPTSSTVSAISESTLPPNINYYTYPESSININTTSNDEDSSGKKIIPPGRFVHPNDHQTLFTKNPTTLYNSLPKNWYRHNIFNYDMYIIISRNESTSKANKLKVLKNAYNAELSRNPRRGTVFAGTFNRIIQPKFPSPLPEINLYPTNNYSKLGEVYINLLYKVYITYELVELLSDKNFKHLAHPNNLINDFKKKLIFETLKLLFNNIKPYIEQAFNDQFKPKLSQTEQNNKKSNTNLFSKWRSEDGEIYDKHITDRLENDKLSIKIPALIHLKTLHKKYSDDARQAGSTSPPKWYMENIIKTYETSLCGEKGCKLGDREEWDTRAKNWNKYKNLLTYLKLPAPIGGPGW